jgi:hypothetical protein
MRAWSRLGKGVFFRIPSSLWYRWLVWLVCSSSSSSK